MLMAMLADETMKPQLHAELQEYLLELNALAGNRRDSRSDYPYFDDYWQEIDERFPLAFFVNGELAGFCLLRYIVADTAFEVAEFMIKPEYRRKGYGAQAVEKMKGFCLSVAKNPVITARVFMTHPYAGQFWEKQGFKFSRTEEDQHIFVYGER